jgi:hypothetical protein
MGRGVCEKCEGEREGFKEETCVPCLHVFAYLGNSSMRRYMRAQCASPAL